MTAVENKIPHLSSLVKETGYKIKTIELKKKHTDRNYNKYITTPKFNKLTAENFAARLKQANLVTKTDFDDELKNSTTKKLLQTKHVVVENELKKLETFDTIYFCGKSHFEDNFKII